MREPDFELSADMRLLELQRRALGLPPRERLAWESRSAAEGSLPIPPTPEEPGKTAVLAVEATAHPQGGVIPGALVTFTLSIANEGAVRAGDIAVVAPLPGGGAYRPGSFVWNGRSTYDEVAESFFGSGLDIGALGPAERATFTWKVGVKLGTKPLVVSPRIRAEGVAVIGARPVIVGRREQATTAFADQLSRADLAAYEPKPLIPVDISAVDLPIYELDDEEAMLYEATDAAVSMRRSKRSAEPPADETVEAQPPEMVESTPDVQPRFGDELAAELASTLEPLAPVDEAVPAHVPEQLAPSPAEPAQETPPAGEAPPAERAPSAQEPEPVEASFAELFPDEPEQLAMLDVFDAPATVLSPSPGAMQRPVSAPTPPAPPASPPEPPAAVTPAPVASTPAEPVPAEHTPLAIAPAEAAAVEIAAVDAAAAVETVPAQPVAPAQEAAALREGIVLFGRFDRATIAFFERTFESAKPPTILQHCIFSGALACGTDVTGSDAWTLKRHLDAQSSVLHRIVLHEKLGKREPIADYAGELLASLDELTPVPIEPDRAPAASKDALILSTELSEPTRQVLQRISEERARWDFVKARQLTLGLQAQTIVGDRVDPLVREQLEAALQAYAQASVTMLQKLFVRIRIDRTTGLLFQTEPSLDVAAKTVIAGFKTALE